MLGPIRSLYEYRELLGILIWKNIIVRYKQAYLGIAWAVLKPLMLMLIFSLVKSFVGIDSGDIPYPLLTFAALLPWVFFQESASEGVNSVVSNSALVKKIYFPREVFPIAAVFTKLVEFFISFIILVLLMIYYDVGVTAQVLWLPLIVFYTMIVSLCIGLVGAAANVYFRDIATALPVALSLLMYASPVIYPIELVRKTLIDGQAAGDWSNTLYTLYMLNPMAGIIDTFQNILLRGYPPNIDVILPGLLVTLVFFPIGYMLFRRAETHFADVI